jgi:hypothetical protein
MMNVKRCNVNRFVLIFALVVFLAFAGSVVSAVDQPYEALKENSELSKAMISVDDLKGSFTTSSATHTSPSATKSDAVKGRFSSVTRPYSTIVYTPVLTPVQDPIIGGWRQTGDYGYDDRYRFYADGTWEESYYFWQAPGEPYVSGITGTTAKFSGTWTANGGNSYTLRVSATGTTWTMIYDPVRNCIYDPRFPSLLKYPYSGNVAGASTSSSTPTITPVQPPTYTYTPKTYTYTPKVYTYTPKVYTYTPKINTYTPIQDPIVGGWRQTWDYGYDDRYRFYADGTWEESYYFWQGPGVPYTPGITGTTGKFSGTWTANGDNSYTLRNSATGSTKTIIYDPVRNCIYDPRYPSLLKYPYSGDIVKGSILSVNKQAINELSGPEMEKTKFALNNQLAAIG